MESSYLPDPERFRPLSPVAYVGYGLLFLVPGVGLIVAILLAFLSKRVNLRLFSRACLIWYAIGVVAFAILAGVMYTRGTLFEALHNVPKALRLLFP